MWTVAVKTDEERGPIGAWARRARIAAGYTSAEAATRAANEAGFDLKLVYLRGIEAGTNRPGRELLHHLADLYGTEPPVGHAPPVSEEWLEALEARLLSVVSEAVARGVQRGLAQSAVDEGPLPRPSQSPRQERRQ